jgi:hypothetical protein
MYFLLRYIHNKCVYQIPNSMRKDFEKLIVVYLVKNYPHFVVLKGSLPCSQDPTPELYLGPN